VLLFSIMGPSRTTGGDCRQKCFPLGCADGATYPPRRRVLVNASTKVVVIIGHSSPGLVVAKDGPVESVTIRQ
jgi:hypothetical protein